MQNGRFGFAEPAILHWYKRALARLPAGLTKNQACERALVGAADRTRKQLIGLGQAWVKRAAQLAPERGVAGLL